VWASILALFLSLLAVSSSVYIYLLLSTKLDKSEIRRELEIASEEILKTNNREMKALETEWDNMYQKFSSLAGRMDRKKALEKPAPEPIEAAPRSRSDLLRRRRENV
jgi:hypothetical protein